jgi:site-specific recombinase XerD
MPSTALLVSSPSLDTLIEMWLNAKFNKSGSPKTAKAYRDTLEQFRSKLQAVGLDLDADQPEQLAAIALAAQGFASWSARGKAVSAATMSQRLAILSSFYEYAIKQTLLTSNPIKRVDRPKRHDYQQAHPLDSSVVESQLEQIDRSTEYGKRDYALLALLFYTGRRLSEITGISLGDITMYQSKITVTFQHCKGGKVMVDTLPYSIGYALLDWLHAYYGPVRFGQLADRRPVFVTLTSRAYKTGSAQRGDRLGRQSVADICHKRLGTSKVHTTRHTFVRLMIEVGAPLDFIQDRLGHESLATTGRYAKAVTRNVNPYAEKLAAHLGFH